MGEREIIETEIHQINDALGELGPHGNLLTEDGFPRDDIDIIDIRHKRHRLACLQTDHVAVMKRIESLMPQVFEIRRQRQQAKPAQASASASPGTGKPAPTGAGSSAGAGRSPAKPSLPVSEAAVDIAAKPVRALPEITVDSVAIARVNSVAPGTSR